MAGDCECGNELPGSIECCEYLDPLWNYQLFMKDYAPWNWLVILNTYSSACVGSVCKSLGKSKRSIIILVAFHLRVYIFNKVTNMKLKTDRTLYSSSETISFVSALPILDS